jgi:excisionase family DNA binding protein
MPEHPVPAFLTTEEVAERLRVQKTTLQRWCREGKMPHTQVGRRYLIAPADLEKWLHKRTKRETWRKRGGNRDDAKG